LQDDACVRRSTAERATPLNERNAHILSEQDHHRRLAVPWITVLISCALAERTKKANATANIVTLKKKALAILRISSSVCRLASGPRLEPPLRGQAFTAAQ
jgi:hypothetical protein